jgi:zinc transporter ZupT
VGKHELAGSCCIMSVPLPSGLWERPFAAAAAFGFMTYVLNLVGVVSAMCLAKISPQKEAFFSAVSAGLILASATGGLISGAVTTADSEGIRGAFPLASGLLAALLTMMAFERLLVHLQKKNSAVISWMIASPVARDDEGVQILEMEHDSMASAADERDSAPMRPARVHGAAAHSSSSLHEVIDQNLAASTDSSTDRRPTEAKLRAAMMLVLAMTVHHIPESMALGVAVYGVSDGSIQQGQCIVLAAVLALQNIPEGAACTSSLRMLGMKNSWRLVFISQLAG